MSLGDSFPDSYKSDFSKRNLKIGKVLRLKVKDTKPPKIKRFIIVGFSKDRVTLASVYINSEINRNINWSQEQQSLQVETTPDDNRDYIDKPSYIDCSKLIIQDYEQIQSAIESRPGAVIGELSFHDLDYIIKRIREAKTIKNKLKKRYGIIDFSE